jgi:hypothetical protein
MHNHFKNFKRFYLSTCTLLNTFRALLCPSSGAFPSLHTQPLFTFICRVHTPFLFLLNLFWMLHIKFCTKHNLNPFLLFPRTQVPHSSELPIGIWFAGWMMADIMDQSLWKTARLFNRLNYWRVKMISWKYCWSGWLHWYRRFH